MLVALGGALLLAFAQGSHSIEPDTTARAMIKGWYSLKASSAARTEAIAGLLQGRGIGCFGDRSKNDGRQSVRI